MSGAISYHRRKQKKDKEALRTLQAMNAIKMASILVLRNKGWGAEELKDFSGEFNTVLGDVSNGWLSLSDIAETIEKETGLTLEDLRI